MALRARFAAICRVRARLLAPPGAATLAESSEALDQSIRPASPRRSSRARWSLSHTPALCHSLRHRQQVIPEPQPISWGSISQGIPDLSTNRMPVRAARSFTRGRPPLGLGGCFGKSEWFDYGPKFVSYEWFRHGRRIRDHVVLLGALSERQDDPVFKRHNRPRSAGGQGGAGAEESGAE